MAVEPRITFWKNVTKIGVNFATKSILVFGDRHEH